MKNLYPNITDILTAKFISEIAQIRKLKRYWGTEMHNGVEVFTKEKTFYPSMNESTEKLAKYIGAYKDLTADQKGIDRAWLKLDINKAADTVVSISSTTLEDNLNKALAMKESSTVKVTIGARPSNSIEGYELQPNYIPDDETDPTVLVDLFESTFIKHWLDGFSITTDSEDPYLSALVMCALRKDPSIVEVKKVLRTVEFVRYPEAIDGKIDEIYTTKSYSASVDILIEDINSNPAIAGMLQHVFTEDLITSKVITSEIRNAAAELGYTGANYAHNDHWIHEFGLTGPKQTGTIGKYYLKADFFETTSLKRKDAIKYFMSVIGSGYKKKKKKWYETLLVVVVIGISFFVAGPAGAAAAFSITTPALAAAVYFSTVLVMASLYISLAAYAFSKLGMLNVTTALGQFLRTINPLTKVAGVILTFAAVYTAIQQALKKAATEAVKQGAAKSALDSVIKLAKVAIEKVTGVTTLSNMQLSHMTKMVQFTFNIYKDWEMRNLEKELKNYRNELAELQEAEEQFRTSDIAKDLMAIYPNPLSIDESVYAERYDRPYEWWSTTYHTGGMQANSVNALWLTRD